MMLITTIKSLGCHQGEFRCLLVLEVMEINVPWPRIYLVWYLGVSGLPSWQGEIYPLLCTFTANKGGFCHFFSFSFQLKMGHCVQESSRHRAAAILFLYLHANWLALDILSSIKSVVMYQNAMQLKMQIVSSAGKQERKRKIKLSHKLNLIQ